MKEVDYADFGRRVRKRRNELGWTQSDLARQIHSSISFVGHLERGTRKASLDTLVAISNAMSISMDELLVASLEIRQQEKAGKLELNQSQRSVMKEILFTLHQHLANWDGTEEEE